MPFSKKYMSISERRLFLRIFDVLFLCLFIWLLNYTTNFQYINFSGQRSFRWMLTLIFYLMLFGEIFELYDLKVANDTYASLKSIFLTVIFTMLFYMFTPIFTPELPQNRIQLFFFTWIIFMAIIISRILYSVVFVSPKFYKRIVVIGKISKISKIIHLNNIDESYHIEAYISDSKIEGEEEIEFISINEVNLLQLVNSRSIKEIIVNENNPSLITPRIKKQLINLVERGISLKSIDRFLEEETLSISQHQLDSNFYNYFSFNGKNRNRLYNAFRKFLDIIFSLLGVLFFLVLIPFVFIGNILGNSGKLFYFQKRVGENGKVFNIIKFRTMVQNAEEKGVTWAKKNDKRITPFGKILRKSRIDEVPQFLNVLKGEMSLIGPRPERPEFMNELESELPYYHLRHVIKPGLTGWAQVMHPYANTFKDQQQKLMYDLYYIKERNLLLDFKIVIKTITTILFFRGT